MFVLEKALFNVTEYIIEMNKYLDRKLYVRVCDCPEHWRLCMGNDELTEGGPEHIAKRIKQIAKEHGLDWLIEQELDPDSWWAEEE